MPTISKLSTITITPEQFVNACSETELQELALALAARLDREIRMAEVEQKIQKAVTAKEKQK